MRERVVMKSDADYERLCAIRRRTEQKARRTKEIKDLRRARKAERYVRRYLEKLRPPASLSVTAGHKRHVQWQPAAQSIHGTVITRQNFPKRSRQWVF